MTNNFLSDRWENLIIATWAVNPEVLITSFFLRANEGGIFRVTSNGKEFNLKEKRWRLKISTESLKWHGKTARPLKR